MLDGGTDPVEVEGGESVEVDIMRFLFLERSIRMEKG